MNKNKKPPFVPKEKKALGLHNVLNLKTKDDVMEWLKNYMVNNPGDEPDTKSAFDIPFEDAGIKPYGWNTNPYSYTYDQIGLGKMFADNFSEKCCFNHTSRTWYVFEAGTGWIVDPGQKKVIDLVRAFRKKLEYALSLMDIKENHNNFESYLSMLTSAQQMREILYLASCDNCFSSSDLDEKKDILATKNGIIQLKRDGTHVFRPFHPEDMTSRHLNTIYDPNATCPRHIKFIEEILNGDKEAQRFLKMVLGQMLFGENDQKAFVILYGPKTNNGKSTLMSTILGLMGDYGITVNESMVKKRSQMAVGDLAELAKTKGARLVTLPEPSQDLQIDVATMKNITGRAPVSARFLHQNSFQFVPGYTLFIDTNHELMIRDLTLFKRGSVILFRFDRSFVGESADVRLEDKLREEFPGILNWLLEGWADYCATCPNGSPWKLPEAMQEDIERYWHQSDLVRQFLEESYTITGNRHDIVSKKDVYQEYRNWSHENGDRPKSNKVVQREIGCKLGNMLGLPDGDIPECRATNSARSYYGIRPKDSTMAENNTININSKRPYFYHFIFEHYAPSAHTTMPLEVIYQQYTDSLSDNDDPLTFEECRWILEDFIGQPIKKDMVAICPRDQQQVTWNVDSISVPDKPQKGSD